MATHFASIVPLKTNVESLSLVLKEKSGVSIVVSLLRIPCREVNDETVSEIVSRWLDRDRFPISSKMSSNNQHLLLTTPSTLISVG